MEKNQLERIGRLFSRLTNSQLRPVSRATLEAELEASSATIKRDIRFLRDRLYIPIDYDHQRGGYYIKVNYFNGRSGYSVPGLWISGEQAYGLLTLYNVLKKVGPGFITSLVGPLTPMLKQIMIDSEIRGYRFDQKIDVDLDFNPEGGGETLSTICYALANDKHASIKFKKGAGLPNGEYLPIRLTLKSTGWALTAEATQTGNRSVEIPTSQIAECTVIEAVDIEDRAPPFPAR